ncbi:DNA polymerase III subunit beta [Motilibacter aurantiacus]|uniref:DNA polymerase III subunit beta n=1 Tax=Motilibacter aurantiacus TaxID=2714955 RepID=UPI00140E4CFE|nr:DNA polymerase III subunit beta [Motilibacter aurantiacus]
MRFRVQREVLAEAVAWAARSLPARPPVPVLAGLLVEAGDDGVVLAGFDYEVSARVGLDAEVVEPGRVLVSGRLLADICRSLPPQPVEIATDGAKVVVRCGSARFTLLTLPVEEYPALPVMPTASGSLPGDVFAAAVAQVSLAAGRDDTLPVLTGVRVEIDGEKVVLAATDRYRLAVRELAWTPEEAGLSAVALVPARTLSESARSLQAGEKVVVALASGGAGEGLVGFEGGRRRTTTRLLDGEFPKYQSLLPTTSASIAVVETGPFVDAVKRVALVAERNTPIRLSFTDGSLTLEAGSGEEASASESIDAALEGDDIAIAFNPQYLLDGLQAIDAPYAQLSFTTSTKPAVVTGRATADTEPSGDYRYLLMPVRLSGA